MIAVSDPSNIAPPTAPGPTTLSISLGSKPFASPWYSVGQEICKNLFLELASSLEAKASFFLLKIAGLRRFGAIPSTNSGACRMLFTASNKRVFTVIGSQLLELAEDGTRTLRGTLNSSQGPVIAADNGSLLMLVDGMDGWILRYADSNLTVISDPDFPGVEPGTLAPTHVAVLDTYFVVNVPATNTYRWSWPSYVRTTDPAGDQAPYDPALQSGYWDPLNLGMKVGSPDNIVALIKCNNYLWLIGQDTSEVHYDTGNYNTQLFARYQGALFNLGTDAPFSVAVYQNNIFWLGRDNRGSIAVWTNSDMAPVKISTRGIEQMIEDMGTWSDAVGWTYWQSGHPFYVLQFAAASRTLVYDAQVGAWHERTHLAQATGADVRWDGLWATAAWGKVISGDMATPALYTLDPRYYQNDNPMDSGVSYIRCQKTTPIQFSNGVNVAFYWIQIECNKGDGLPVDTAEGVGVDPHVQVAWSDDTGRTWSNERSARIGKQGEYSHRPRIPGCGAGRNRVLRITMTDPVPFILVGVLANVQAARF